MGSHNIRAKKRYCSPELLEQYPLICIKGIRQYEIQPGIKWGFTDYYLVTGHYHFTIDNASFVEEEEDVTNPKLRREVV